MNLKEKLKKPSERGWAKIVLISIPIGIGFSVSFGVVTLPEFFNIIFGVALFAFAGALVFLFRQKTESNPEEVKQRVKELAELNTLKDKVKELQSNPQAHMHRDSKLLTDFLHEAKENVYVLAIDAGSFSEGKYQTLEERIKAGVKFMFLLANPESHWLQDLDDITISPDSKGKELARLKQFKEIKDKLDDDHKDFLIIKFYDLPPVHSMFIIDPKLNGKMTVELYDYDTEPFSRTNIIISENDHPAHFKKYYEKFNYVLEKSKDWDFKQFISSEDTHSG